MTTSRHPSEEMLNDIAQQIQQAGATKKKVATMHWLMLVHSADLEHMTGPDFCARVGLLPKYKAEFTKMRNLGRLMRAQGFTIERDA